MYEQFFGLKDKPFALTPNTRFVFSSSQYAEVETQVIYGIDNREGLMLVTGQPGTGKTMLCRGLVERLDRDKNPNALVFSPYLTGSEMLAVLLREFGIPVPENGSYHELLDRLHQFLLAKLALGKRCVAIFDEAQDLPPETLEQIRVLTNLETDHEKLIQIVLVGQPELHQILRTPRLAQLEQRVSIRCALGEYDEQETFRYVLHRLEVAGADGQVRLGSRTLREIHRGSHGVPRLINLVADRALLAGFAARTRTIEPEHVRKALAALRGEDGVTPRGATTGTRRWRRRAMAIMGVAIVAVSVAGLSLWSRRDQGEIGAGQAIEVAQPTNVDRARSLALTAILHLDRGDTTAACHGLPPDLAQIVSADSMLARRLTALSSACTTGDAP